jgi:hypothetical protein
LRLSTAFFPQCFQLEESMPAFRWRLRGG